MESNYAKAAAISGGLLSAAAVIAIAVLGTGCEKRRGEAQTAPPKAAPQAERPPEPASVKPPEVAAAPQPAKQETTPGASSESPAAPPTKASVSAPKPTVEGGRGPVVHGLQLGMSRELAVAAMKKLPDLTFKERDGEMAWIVIVCSGREFASRNMINGKLREVEGREVLGLDDKHLIKVDSIPAWRAAIPEYVQYIDSNPVNTTKVGDIRLDVIQDGIYCDDLGKMSIHVSHEKVDGIQIYGPYASRLFQAEDLSNKAFAQAFMDAYGVPELKADYHDDVFGENRFYGWKYEDQSDGWKMAITEDKGVFLGSTRRLSERGFGK